MHIRGYIYVLLTRRLRNFYTVYVLLFLANVFLAGLICTPAVPRRDVDICFCSDVVSRKSKKSTGGMAPRPELARRAARLKAPYVFKKVIKTCVLMFLSVCP